MPGWSRRHYAAGLRHLDLSSMFIVLKPGKLGKQSMGYFAASWGRLTHTHTIILTIAQRFQFSLNDQHNSLSKHAISSVSVKYIDLRASSSVSSSIITDVTEKCRCYPLDCTYAQNSVMLAILLTEIPARHSVRSAMHVSVTSEVCQSSCHGQ